MNIVLYFGSFNPIHIGHLALANYVQSYGGFDELWFVVTPCNPFKRDQQLWDDDLRLELARRATRDCPFLNVSDVEFTLPRPSYTANTLRRLRELYPEHAFTLLMGGDNWAGFPKWRESDEILRMCQVLVYPRPGYELDATALPQGVRLLQAPLLEISSTFIRQAMGEGRDMRYFLHPSSMELLEEMKREMRRIASLEKEEATPER